MIFTKKKYLLILFIPISIFAYTDSDMDGVEDMLDKCPNTSLIDLVNSDGCPIEQLDSSHHFDIILGIKSIKIKNKTTSKNLYLSIKTVQIDYFYKNFSFNISGAKNDSKLLDTYLSIKYKYEYNDLWTFYTSFNIILPTYKSTLNNNHTDYSALQSIYYKKEDLYLFGAYRFTIVNDVDNLSINYKNTNSYTLGVGYDISSQLYSSISISSVDSAFKDTSSSKSANIYFLYSLDDNYFTNISFTKSYNNLIISDTLSLRVGYYY